MIRRTFVLLSATLALAACAVGPYGGPGSYGAPQSLGQAPPGAVAPAGRRVAILLPLSGPMAGIGQAMLNAAKLALSGPGSPPLESFDTQGSPAGAAAAAQQAIAQKAGLILGPLTAPETAAVAPVARAAGVNVLAFTNDSQQAGPGVWTLGISPGQQVGRLVRAAQAGGRTRLAALVPNSPFGQSLASALSQDAASAGDPPPRIQTYGGSFASMNAAARDISDYANRRGPLDARIKAANSQGTAAGRVLAHRLARQPIPPAPFDGLLLAATGENLREMATLLPYYDMAQPQVRLMGPMLWAQQASQIAGVSGLAGAWYPAPDPTTRIPFTVQYTQAYGSAPPLVADLAFDAAAIARVAADGPGFTAGALTSPAGFTGVDGPIVLTQGGHVRRGLALFRIAPGGGTMIQPAPATLTGPSS
ncbi:MAG TPA: penicillin-binding protein activator [Acetobacteraceae bacterium]|nr:penicillin-binding protein activator [Acetobacteraceae bacterium]